MKRLSEFENEDAIVLVADILKPASAIMADKEIAELMRSKKATKLELIDKILHGYPSEILKIMAILDEADIKTYRVNTIQLTKNLMYMLNDEELMSFFSSQGQTEEQK